MAATKRVGPKDVRREAKPIQIVQQCSLVLDPRPLPIMIFDSQQDATIERSCQTPHENRIDDVAEVEEARRGGSKARERPVQSQRETADERWPVDRPDSGLRKHASYDSPRPPLDPRLRPLTRSGEQGGRRVPYSLSMAPGRRPGV